MPAVLSWIIGGCLGGAIGAGIWAAVAHFLHAEVGWIAWGIGGLVGLGVRIGSRDPGGAIAGMVAATIAIAAVLCGKYAAVKWDMDEFYNPDDRAIANIADHIAFDRGIVIPMFMEEATSLRDFIPPTIWSEAEQQFRSLPAEQQSDVRQSWSVAYPEYLTSFLADQICSERIDSGEPLEWPPGSTFDTAWREKEYPADVWADAEERLAAMPPSERDAYDREVRSFLVANDAQGLQEFTEQTMKEGFFATFSPFDVVWGALAVVTAFSLGSGLRREQQ